MMGQSACALTYFFVKEVKQTMQKIVGIIMAIASVLAVYFIIKEQFNIAVILIAVTFTLTNGVRAKDMVAKGYVKEAKFVRGVAIFFGILAVAAIASLFV